jgi:hypothetical protein
VVFGTLGVVNNEPAPADPRADRRAELRHCAVVIVVLCVGGALLGLLWQAWSPPGPFGVVLPAGIEADETEAWAAGDGRFAFITAAVGVLAGLVVWFVRRARGPNVVLALTAGGLAGAALTEWIGHLVRGSGRTLPCGSPTGKCIDHLPLEMHMTGLLLLEPLIALLIYALFAAFAARDDLGRPDPVREQVLVGAGEHPQDGGGDGDAARPPQEGDFAPE